MGRGRERLDEDVDARLRRAAEDGGDEGGGGPERHGPRANDPRRVHLALALRPLGAAYLPRVAACTQPVNDFA